MLVQTSLTSFSMEVHKIIPLPFPDYLLGSFYIYVFMYLFIYLPKKVVWRRYGGGLVRGMCESVSKEITIEDCSAEAFKAMLRFLYSDDFNCVESLYHEATLTEEGSSSSSSNEDHRTWLQNLLAVSHKYALGRLQAWCEQKLSNCVSIEGVCSILGQAHLYEAWGSSNAANY